MNKNFYTWLHELTLLGYEKDIIIPSSLEDDVKKCFLANQTPTQAINTIIGLAHFRGIALHTAKPNSSTNSK